jgi:cytidylate kinase
VTRGVAVVVSGLTAAGKTTHATLLARDLRLRYVSATALLARLVADRTGGPVASRWQPSLDAARRRDQSIDDELDRALSATLCEPEGGVFDACLLPWMGRRRDAVHVWIESDLDSRVRKCVVSHWGEGIDRDAAEQRVISKDSFTVARLARSAAEDYLPDERFSVVADNSALIPRATPETARAGVEAFRPVLTAAVAFAAGIAQDPPASPWILRARRQQE